MRKIIGLLLIFLFCLTACGEDNDDIQNFQTKTTFNFTHNWDGNPVTNVDFNTIQYANENGEILSIERLRYLISDIRFTGSSGEIIELEVHNLIDVTNETDLSFSPATNIPLGNYSNVSFTFGFDNEDNAENFIDLNSASFNVPEMLGGGYHFMQLDGKFINSNNTEQGFNYHSIRAVDNPGPNPTFPQDTFFTVNLGAITITEDINFEIKMNIAEWFRNPNLWDLNILNTVLMPNSSAQIMMNQNGQNVFSLGTVSQ